MQNLQYCSQLYAALFYMHLSLLFILFTSLTLIACEESMILGVILVQDIFCILTCTRACTHTHTHTRIHAYTHTHNTHLLKPLWLGSTHATLRHLVHSVGGSPLPLPAGAWATWPVLLTHPPLAHTLTLTQEHQVVRIDCCILDFEGSLFCTSFACKTTFHHCKASSLACSLLAMQYS